MRPVTIPSYIQTCWAISKTDQAVFDDIKEVYKLLRKAGDPEVCVVIPAYNEEDSIVQTLRSLCFNQTDRAVEIIVVNNNSTDKTVSLVEKCGVKCIHQTIQGITPTRNHGLANAIGKFILNADADSIYPQDWIEEMVRPLAEDEKVALTYGRFSFIPVGSTGRFTYFFYEYLADFSRSVNKVIKDEAVCVYGFNSGFRREQGMQVGGFDHPPGTNEDGWLALKLRDKGFGRLHYVSRENALVWTTDRRIQIDGGLIPGMIKRIKRVLLRR